jgi:stearoyl-CoA desaturase (Delta-9 desaturase)
MRSTHEPAEKTKNDQQDWSASPDNRISLRLRLINLGAVIIPFAGLIAAVILLWGVALNWTILLVFFVMYVATGLGVTVGYHRYFTHLSFKTPRPMQFVLGVLGSMAVQGPVLEWVATHRQHHQHSDHDHDPHSPHGHGESVLAVLRGMWHAHVGWMFVPAPQVHKRYVTDLQRDKLVRFISRTFPYWVVLGLLIPAGLGFVLTGTWMGALLGFIWGGLVRIFLVHHITWSVNSVCHLWGSRPFRTKDESRDNAIVGVLAFGEGWHNSHHAFPTSAKHGLDWWKIDVSYLVIRAMALVGLASEIRVPGAERQAAKRREMRPR